MFQAGGRLYLLNVASEKLAEVPVKVVTDEITLRPRAAKVAPLIETSGISPTGKRGVFAAAATSSPCRPSTAPVMNLTRVSGVAERYPSWSPDGKTGRVLERPHRRVRADRPSRGRHGRRAHLTKLGPGFRYRPQWSPDSRNASRSSTNRRGST